LIPLERFHISSERQIRRERMAITSKRGASRPIIATIATLALLSVLIAPASAQTAKPVEISVYMPGRPEGPISNDMPIIKEMSAKTGIKFKWEQAPSDMNQYTEKFNILVASGDIPDIMILADKELLNRGGASGIFEPLNGLIDTYMPNVKKKFAEKPIVEKQLRSDDGKIYYLARLTAVKPMNILIGRQDWLDKLGLKAPTTANEMYAVLKAFKEKDPNGNGKADEIPFTCRGKFGSLTPFFEAYGMFIKEPFFVENGKVKYTYTDPRFKKGLEFVNKLFMEKLIDNEYLTNDLNIWSSRLTNNVSGMTFDVFVRAEFLNNLIKKSNPEALFMGFIPLKGPDGKPATKDQQNPTGVGAVISADSKYKVEIAKFFNWMYSDEGIMLTNFGIEGSQYTYVNGQPKYTDRLMKDPTKTPQFVLYSEGWRDNWPYYTDIRYENAMSTDLQIKIRDSIVPYIIPNYPSALSLTNDERKIQTAKFAQLNTYYEEMSNKFVMGVEPLSKFDDYVKKMEQIGLQDVLKVQQAAYDRYLKR
jgi:putative aldouronate transport system substrate-binding protein